MDYQVTARKYRPQHFSEVIGQEHVTRALKNAIQSGKIPHAYLFSGPRGVGKTTSARLLAKALNCQTGPTAEPCGKCAVCTEIAEGRSLDVREIDGASNRGIDDIREIRDNVHFLPLNARYKIYIIDEVHMLTKEASNALLKTLEEPPEHVIFILATTEPHKVLATIRSRTQHYVFKMIPTSVIADHLKGICGAEKISATDDGLFEIAKASGGSMRDAQSIFDQVALYSDGKITKESAVGVLGIPDDSYFDDLLSAVVQQNAVKMLSTVDHYLENSGDTQLFLKNFIEYLRNGLLVLKLSENHGLLDLTQNRIESLKTIFASFSPDDVVKMITIAVEDYPLFKGDSAERFLLEVMLFKLLDFKNRVPISQLQRELLKLGGQSAPRATGQSQSRPMPTPPQQQQRQNRNNEFNDSRREFPRNQSSGNAQVSTVEEAFRLAISRSPMLRTLAKDIRGLAENGDVITVTMAKDSSREFIASKATELESSMEGSLGRKVKLNFVTAENPAPIDQQPPRDDFEQVQNVSAPKPVEEEAPAEKKKNEDPIAPPAQENKNSEGEDDILNGMADLFGGKFN